MCSAQRSRVATGLVFSMSINGLVGVGAIGAGCLLSMCLMQMGMNVSEAALQGQGCS